MFLKNNDNKGLGYNYIILFKRFNVVKIGYSKDIFERIDVLTKYKIQNLIDLNIVKDTYDYEILGIYESTDGFKDEKKLHKFFKDKKSGFKKEYFYIDKQDIANLENKFKIKSLFEYGLLNKIIKIKSNARKEIHNLIIDYPKILFIEDERKRLLIALGFKD